MREAKPKPAPKGHQNPYQILYVRLSADDMARFDKFRYDHMLPTRSDALRKMIDVALGPGSKKL